MPLFMDIHISDDFTIDEVKEAHLSDLEVQEKYNVKYHQYWVNQEAGTVFCLMEGPDKESCEATHREAHGNVACKIVEVESGFYNLFMGKNHRLDHGLVRNEDGGIDLGYRFVLIVDIRGNTDVTSSSDYKLLKFPEEAKRLAMDYISHYEGKEVKVEGDDSIVAVFKKSMNAVSCAVEIKNKFEEKISNTNDAEWDILFKMGLSGGQPLTEDEGFFESVLKVGRRLNLIAEDKEILASPVVRKLSDVQKAGGLAQHIRFIDTSEEKFLNNLIETVEENMSDNNFNVKSLSRDIGMSRSQLYRKVRSITGRSPNRFVRDVRMRKALMLIREKEHNISEVSLEVGFHNPSYFSKCFQEQYGITPSKVIS